jgi:hypothetical protein
VPIQNSVRIKNSEIQHKTKEMIVCFYQVNFNNPIDLMFKSLFLFLRKSFTTKTQLILENLYLTKQLEILQRTAPKLQFNRTDQSLINIELI